MRNQKGITLIALVITIIVLLILAGVSIAMLTGDNGILTQANNAKVSQIEGQVKEEVNLAVQAAKMFAEQKAVETSTGWLASDADKLGTASDTAGKETVIGQLRNDLTTTKGYKTIEPTTQVAATGTDGIPAGYTTSVKITYETDDYKSATNKTNAKIEIYVGVKGNTFEIGSIVTTDRT